MRLKFLTALVLALAAAAGWAESVVEHLSDRDLGSIRQEWGTPHRNESVGGVPIRVGGELFPTGIGTHAASSWRLMVDGRAQEFRARAGVQDGAGQVEFRVLGDGRALFASGPLKGGDKAVEVRVPLQGVQELELAVLPLGSIDADHANWIDPVVVHTGASLAASTRVARDPRWPNLEEVVVCWKSHCDIGYTHPVPEVLDHYRNGMMDRALQVIDEAAGLPPDQRFVWALPAWVMQLVLDEHQYPARRSRIEQAVRDGRLIWHGLPFTFESDASDLEELVRGLGCGSRLARRFGQPLPRDGKLTDMPSQAWVLPVLLRHAGIEFLHIGVNPWSPNPKVPLLFWWEGPDGSRVLTGYGFHSYSWPLLPPEGWPHKSWLAFQVGGDNSPPPSPDTVRQTLSRIRRELPGVRVRFGRPSDFADAIKDDGVSIPVVRADMPDTWTHGQMSAPVPTLRHRQAVASLGSLGVLDTGLRAWGVEAGDVAPLLAEGYDRAALYTEHTWGICGPAFGTPDHATWERELAAGAYAKQLATFSYHDAYATRAWTVAQDGLRDRMALLARAVGQAGPRVVVFNPLPWPRDARVTVSLPSGVTLPGAARDGGEVTFIASNLPSGGYATFACAKGDAPGPEAVSGDPLETAHFIARFDLERGGIASLRSRADGRELADVRDFALGQYLHEQFSKADVDAFLKAYCQVPYNWYGFPYYDFNKPKLDPALPYRRISPGRWSLNVTRDALGETAVLTAGDTAGLAQGITLTFRFPRAVPAVDITWQVDQKRPELIPEGGWICVPLAVSNAAFRVGHIGGAFSPERDLIAGANRHLFSVDHGLSVRDGAAGVGIGVASADLPLWSLGAPGLWKYTTDCVPSNACFFANLYNNQWNTNYRLWVDGSWSASLRLWPIPRGADEESGLFTPAWELRQPAVAAYSDGPAGALPPRAQGLALSRKGIRVTAFCPNPDGPGTLLRVWEQAGAAGAVCATLPGRFKTATPVSLRGETSGAPISLPGSELRFNLPAYAPASFILE